jgi:hypothetical protein
MPASDYKLIAAIQARALPSGLEGTKSKVLVNGEPTHGERGSRCAWRPCWLADQDNIVFRHPVWHDTCGGGHSSSAPAGLIALQKEYTMGQPLEYSFQMTQ